VVTNTGDVTTEGARAHGIFLQSIGGGGGAVFTSANAPSVTLSAQNSGSGGNISLMQNGSIATSGDQAYSIFAQSVGGGGGFVDAAFAGSAGGAGGAGTITLDLDGDVLALGEDSTGLFAQSSGANGLGGDITATLAAGKQLVGGTNGVAVYFDGGAANRFTNYGSLSTLSGPLGTAFRGGAGGDYIDNYGALMGNIDLGGGANGFANNIGAQLYSGTLINLGDASNVFTNNGLIAPGGGQLAVETQLFGSYVQSATGVADFEINLATRYSDRLMATGTARVGGTLNLSMMNLYYIRSGTTWQPLFNAAGGVTDLGVTLNAPQSIVVNYSLYNYPTELGVAYDVDFAAHGKLTGNREAMGEYLNHVQRNGAATGIGDVITRAVLETDVDDYASMLTQLDTEFYAEQQAVALDGVQRFARNLQNCGTLSIGETAGDENGCVWARYDDTPATRESSNGFPDAKHDGFSISSGVQKPLGDAWTLGVALDSGSRQSRGFDGQWSADSKFLQIGGSLRRETGAGSFGATLQLGNDAQEVTRLIDVTAAYKAKGSRDVHFYSSVLDYTWNLEAGGFDFQPSLNFGTSVLRYGGMAEQGAAGQSAIIVGDSETHLWAEPALGARYSANFASGSAMHTFLRVGLLQYLSGTSTEVRSGLAGAPDDADPVPISSQLDRTHVVGEAGLQYEAAGGFTLGLSYTREQSDVRDGGAGSLRFVWPLK
jgi:Autotransporter beta-domain